MRIVFSDFIDLIFTFTIHTLEDQCGDKADECANQHEQENILITGNTRFAVDHIAHHRVAVDFREIGQ